MRWPTSLTRSLAFFRNNVDKLAPRKGDKVVVAMSGGVDSSVVAGLLSREDYDLSAIYMRNWDTRDESGTDNGCEWKKDYADVLRVCKLLDIPCKLVDLSREYWIRVFEPSLAAWESGVTPNPDVWCNREVKFGALMQHITSSTSWIATGHYARKGWSSSLPVPRPQLLRSSDPSKDQTYYLSAIPERSLSRTIFPLGAYTKTEVRQMAHRWELPTADRKESMGICFVGEKRKFEDFIAQYLPPNPGNITELGSGKVVGRHEGLWRFTIGQRARVMSMADKAFVARKDMRKNEIQVVLGTHNPALFSKAIAVKNWSWIWGDSPPPAISETRGMRARVQHRHRMSDVACTEIRTQTSTSSSTSLKTELRKDRLLHFGMESGVWDVARLTRSYSRGSQAVCILFTRTLIADMKPIWTAITD
ncbi:hypothetical protein NM688_g4307 [Phlebia brevispora]|uniref:Uncharacterized protein n=1 Tax=Phlebia brevispora TaxID=194682 RepID=A0ACC1T3F1_9APHY|nr:hypothetical protein NM688_g4307 [Phlebia brevispora]